MSISLAPKCSNAGIRGRQPRAAQLVVSPAFPLDAVVHRVTVNGRPAPFKMIADSATFSRRRSTWTLRRRRRRSPSPTRRDPTSTPSSPQPRLAQTTPACASFDRRQRRITCGCVLEGRGGRSYSLFVRTPRRIGPVAGVTFKPARGGDVQADVTFEGPSDRYVRREIILPLTR